jgi:thioredoxin reductase
MAQDSTRGCTSHKGRIRTAPRLLANCRAKSVTLIKTIQDCIVIGAGPAGLSAAVMLARYGRAVLVFDDNRPRNGRARSLHGFLGHDGIAPSELLKRGRAEATRYGAQIIDRRVEQLASDGGCFRVLAAETYITRTVLLATGVHDVMPQIPGVTDFYGTSVHHCPDCDGYEVRGKSVAVLGAGRRAIGLLKALSVWTEALTLLLNGQPNLRSIEDRRSIESFGVRTIPTRVAALQGDIPTGRMNGIRFVGGEFLPCDAMFFDLGTAPASTLHRDIGCDTDARTQLIKVGRDQQTSVPGVYAAGDITPDSHMVIVAAAEGAMAALQIHKSLLRGQALRAFR